MSLPFPRIRLTVIGTGYLGLTHAVCMAELGHDVLALDVDPAKVAKAARGAPPFFEPGLEPLLRKNLEAGRLRFTTSYSEAGDFGEIHFLCGGTPPSAACAGACADPPTPPPPPAVPGGREAPGPGRPRPPAHHAPQRAGTSRRPGRAGLESRIPPRGHGRPGQHVTGPPPLRRP